MNAIFLGLPEDELATCAVIMNLTVLRSAKSLRSSHDVATKHIYCDG